MWSFPVDDMEEEMQVEKTQFASVTPFSINDILNDTKSVQGDAEVQEKAIDMSKSGKEVKGVLLYFPRYSLRDITNSSALRETVL